MLCVHRFVGLFHLDVSFYRNDPRVDQVLSFVQKKHMGVSLGGLKMMCFFSLRFSWQKSAKSLVNFEKFIFIETQPNWWKLPNPVLARGSFLTSLNLPPSPWNCRKDPFANGYCIRISYGSNTCPNRCRLRSFPEPSKLSTQKPFQGTFNRIPIHHTYWNDFHPISDLQSVKDWWVIPVVRPVTILRSYLWRSG